MAAHKKIVCGREGFLFFLVGLMLAGARAYAASPPNVVLIVLDACREDRIDAARNGMPVMPHLSNFPAVRFRNAISPAPWTLPSMVSVFTSLYVDAHQVHSGKTHVPENLESAASYLKKAGYTTLCVQTNSLMNVEIGCNRGFDVYDYQLLAPADKATALALDHVANAKPPFFLYVHYMDLHECSWPPDDYLSLMGYPTPGLSPEEQKYVENSLSYTINNNLYVYGYKLKRIVPEASAIMKEARWSVYDAAARFADEQSGILIDTLLERYPNTVVVVVADHGEHFWEHGYLGHTLTLYEQLIHVPLFIKAPGLKPATVDSLVETIDILPTIAALAGLPARPAWQGRDLFAPREPDAPVFSSGKFNVLCIKGKSEVVRLGSKKLIFHGDLSLDPFGLYLLAVKLIRNMQLDRMELYDLAADPAETANLASEQPELARQLMAMLYAHLRTNALANGSDGPVIAKPAVSSAEEGSKIALTAGAGSDYRWFKNSQQVANDIPHIVGANTSMLTIHPLRIDNSGDYECMYREATKTQCLRITDPFTLEVTPENGFPTVGILTVAAFVCVIFAGLFLWKRASA